MMNLKDIATIRYGTSYLTHKKAEEQAIMIDARALSADGTLNTERLKRVPLTPPMQKSQLQGGDVLLQCRAFTRFHAVCYSLTATPAIATSSILILRPITTAADSEFLAWVLNQSWMQKQFKRIQQGSTLLSIAPQHVGALSIPLPPLATQHEIIKLVALMKDEQRYVDAMHTAIHRLIHHTLLTHQ